MHPGAIFPTRSGFGILSSGASAAGPLKGVFESLFEALSSDLDFEYTIIDGTIVRVHQHGAGNGDGNNSNGNGGGGPGGHGGHRGHRVDGNGQGPTLGL